jgi:hypothetical protein
MLRLTGASVRRTGALALTGALLTVGLAACGDDATTDDDPGAPENAGPAAADAAAVWLADHLTDGLVVNEEFGVPDYGATVDAIRGLDPSAVLSTHLPPAVGRTDDLFEVLREAPEGPGFVGPDQQALEELLATFEPV